jgi:lipid IVA palmitoyltransferase
LVACDEAAAPACQCGRLQRVAVLCGLLTVAAQPAAAASCEDLGVLLSGGCRRIVDTYERGENGILLSGYAWHLPSTWTPERRAALNANAWGGGLVKTVEDPDGDSHSVFVLAFKDSHSHVEWNVGYEHSTYFGPRDGLQPGIGYTAMIVQRPDLASGVPFPVLLPLASLRYRDATFFATYIPTLNGGINHGSTIYMFGRVLFR